MESKFNPFHVAQQQLDTAAERLGLDEATHELLRWAYARDQDHFARQDGRRLDADFSRISNSIQHGAGACKRRSSMAPGRDRRHGPRPRRMDDLEDVRGGHSSGRRQGGRGLQPQGDVRNRKGAAGKGPTSGPSPGPSGSPRTCRLRTYTPTLRSWPG